ncbi:hypothetical protein D3C75_1236410 [compost metagenome]
MVRAIEILTISNKSRSQAGMGRIIISTMPITPSNTTKSLAFNVLNLPGLSPLAFNLIYIGQHFGNCLEEIGRNYITDFRSLE